MPLTSVVKDAKYMNKLLFFEDVSKLQLPQSVFN
jgi:hypothetical protein